MRFESFNRGTVCIKLSLRDSETVYEQTAFRMRNSFIQELGVSCLPCAGFLPWLYENHNVWNVCRAELIFLGSVYALFGDDKCYKHRFSDDLLPAVVEDLGITSLGFRLGSRNDQRRARQFVDSQLVPLKSLSLYVEGDVSYYMWKEGGWGSRRKQFDTDIVRNSATGILRFYSPPSSPSPRDSHAENSLKGHVITYRKFAQAISSNYHCTRRNIMQRIPKKFFPKIC